MVKPHLFIVFSLLCLFALSSQAKVTHTTVPPARIVWMSDNTGKFVSNPNHLLGTFSGQCNPDELRHASGLHFTGFRQGNVWKDKNIFGYPGM